MPVVQMPDGTFVNLSDNPSPEEVAAVKAAVAKSQPGIWDTIKSGAADLARGAMNAGDFFTNNAVQGKTPMGALGTALAVVGDKVGAATGVSKPGEFLKSTGTPQAEAALPTPQGDSVPRQYVRKGLEAVGGGMATPAGPGALGQVLPNFMGGVGGEAAARLLGDNAITRFLGGLAGSGATSFAQAKVTSPRAQDANLAREALEGIDPKQLQAAQAFQAKAAEMGVKLDLAQALTATGASANNLNTIRDLIANTKEGNKLQGLLRDQPKDVQASVSSHVGAMPGQDYSLPQAANNVQEAATKRIGMATKARTDAVREDYAKVGMLPPEAQQAVIQELQSRLQVPGLSNEARGVIQELLGKFQNAPAASTTPANARAAVVAATKPSQKAAARAQLAEANSAQSATRPIHALDADVALSDALGSYKGSPTYLANPKATGQVRGVGGAVNGLLQQGSPAIQAAERKFASISESDVNPLKQGPVGQFATSRGYAPDRAASVAKLTSFFDAGAAPGNPISPIKILGNELEKSESGTFADAFKSWLTSKIDKHAVGELDANQAHPDALARGIYGEIFGSAKRYEGVKQAVSLVAEQNGVPPAQAVAGLENLGRVLKGASNRPQSVQGVSQEQLQQMSGHSLSANALRVFGFLPFERSARWLENRQTTATFKTFDELLTSPEGAATLARLGKTSPTSPAFGALLQGFETGTLQGYKTNEDLQRQAGQ